MTRRDAQRPGRSLLRRLGVVVTMLLVTATLEVGVLAPPAAAMVFVTTSADSGPGSLREVIASSPANTLITFAPGLAGATITLASDLPAIRNTLTIDGEDRDITIDGDLVARSGMTIEQGDLTVRNLTFTRGFSPTVGDAFFVDQGSLLIRWSTLIGQPFFPSGDTSGIEVSQGVLTIQDSLVTTFASGLGGGAIDAIQSDVTLTNVDFLNNSGIEGGALHLQQSKGLITSSAFTDNRATAGGGAIAAEGNTATLDVIDSSFDINLSIGNELNPTNSGGGAVLLRTSVKATITGTTFAGNRTNVFGDGGALAVKTTASATVTNSTFSENFITVDGNGGSTHNDGVLDLNNVTIALSAFGQDNGFYGGGHGTGASGMTTIHNSVLSGSVGGDCGNLGSTTVTFSLVQDPTSPLPANACAVSVAAGNISGVDPLLGDLLPNGGPTDTHALLANSDAIDAGGSPCPTTDQRGEGRVDGSCDMGAFEATPQCAGLDATILWGPGAVATSGPDVIIGTPGADLINSLGGDDVICGFGGDDVINSGPDNDTVFAGDGADTVFGLDGNDEIYGGDGMDELLGFNGADMIFGGADADTINGGPGGDTLHGDDGADRIFAQGGNDTVFGGSGDDLVIGLDGVDTINGGPGADTLNGGPDGDTIHGDKDGDVIYGVGGDDMLFGDDGPDLVFGQIGADTVDGGPGDDFVWGNEGNDVLTDPSGDNSLNGGPGNDDITGGSGPDDIFGDGNLLQAGDDIINGGLGADLLIGFAGNDTIIANDGVADTVNGGPDTTGDSCTVDVIDTVFNCNP